VRGGVPGEPGLDGFLHPDVLFALRLTTAPAERA
jgi:hypothetical protein